MRSLAAGLAAWIGMLAAPLPSVAQRSLPALGEEASQTLTVGAERRLGDQIMRDVRRNIAYLDDPLLLDHGRALWQRLLGAARQRGDLGPDIDEAFAWDLFLVRDRAVNAFALPGGYVGLHLGLIATTGTADELASVLAHELSHVTQRHIARGIGTADRQGSVGAAAMIIGLLLASRMNNPELAQAAIAGGQAAVVQGQLNFSRDMEREADRIGWAIFRDAGFEPQGMASMFDRLDQAARLNDSGGFPYLRSHPLTTERLAEARSRLSSQGPGTGAFAGGWAGQALLQGRARVLMDPSAQALKRLVALAEAEAGGATPGTVYAGALAALSLGDAGRALAGVQGLWKALDDLAEAAPSVPPGSGSQTAAGAQARVIVALLGAEVSRGQHNRPETQRWLALADRHAHAAAPERPLFPRARLIAHAEAVLLGLGEGASEARGPVEASLTDTGSRLRTWLSEHPNDALAWSMLARVERASGQPLRAARAQAEARAAMGDLDAAIDLLRAAQAASRSSGVGPSGARAADFIEASVIDARLRQWLAQRQQRAAEFRGTTSGSR